MKHRVSINFPGFQVSRKLIAGESFGEIAILTGETRTATLVCSEDTHLLGLSRRNFDAIMGTYKEQLVSETVNFLRRFPFFRSMTPSKLLSLWQLMKEEKYVAGNHVYLENTKCRRIYFVKQGQIEISKLLFDNHSQSNQLPITTAVATTTTTNKDTLNSFSQIGFTSTNMRRRQAANELTSSENTAEINHSTINLNMQPSQSSALSSNYRCSIVNNNETALESINRSQRVANKQKTKRRVRLYQLGEFAYFGASEFIKRLDTRETSAKCVSGEAILYSIDKKKFYGFMKVYNYFEQFKREASVKCEWEDSRKNLTAQSQQSLMKANSIFLSSSSENHSPMFNSPTRSSIPSHRDQISQQQQLQQSLLYPPEDEDNEHQAVNTGRISSRLSQSTSRTLQSKSIQFSQQLHTQQHQQPANTMDASTSPYLLTQSVSPQRRSEHEIGQPTLPTSLTRTTNLLQSTTLIPRGITSTISIKQNTVQQHHPQQQQDQQLQQQQQNAIKSNVPSRKIPKLMSNLIEITQFKKNNSSSKTSYLNQLINKQNKPLVDALESLREQGYSITKLAQLSNDQLKSLIRGTTTTTQLSSKPTSTTLISSSDNNQREPHKSTTSSFPTSTIPSVPTNITSTSASPSPVRFFSTRYTENSDNFRLFSESDSICENSLDLVVKCSSQLHSPELNPTNVNNNNNNNNNNETHSDIQMTASLDFSSPHIHEEGISSTAITPQLHSFRNPLKESPRKKISLFKQPSIFVNGINRQNSLNRSSPTLIHPQILHQQGLLPHPSLYNTLATTSISNSNQLIQSSNLIPAASAFAASATTATASKEANYSASVDETNNQNSTANCSSKQLYSSVYERLMQTNSSNSTSNIHSHRPTHRLITNKQMLISSDRHLFLPTSESSIPCEQPSSPLKQHSTRTINCSNLQMNQSLQLNSTGITTSQTQIMPITATPFCGIPMTQFAQSSKSESQQQLLKKGTSLCKGSTLLKLDSLKSMNKRFKFEDEYSSPLPTQQQSNLTNNSSVFTHQKQGIATTCSTTSGTRFPKQQSIQNLSPKIQQDSQQFFGNSSNNNRNRKQQLNPLNATHNSNQQNSHNYFGLKPLNISTSTKEIMKVNLSSTLTNLRSPASARLAKISEISHNNTTTSVSRHASKGVSPRSPFIFTQQPQSQSFFLKPQPSINTANSIFQRSDQNKPILH